MRALLTKVLGDPNDKALKQIRPIVAEINGHEPAMQARSDQELHDLGQAYRERLAAGETLDDLLPEVFAATREIAKRVSDKRHYDVQLIGGVVLHQGKIAEMKTGEGKTLTATLAVALNALGGKGVHVITVNDYLAKRDTQWMGPIYHALGLSVGCIQHDQAFLFDPEHDAEDERLALLRPVSRREAYQADITHGTNNEFGFDYLRDNMVVSAEQMSQRELSYAIVDEVDNILIDEARTPLIISGQAERATDRYYQFAQIVKQLRPERHYEIDLKHKSVSLTDEGVDKVEQLVGIPDGESIYDDRHSELTHYLEQALKAHGVFHRDKDYIVRDEEVVIVDEFTGRMMAGRRYSEGLHQAIEAKENVRVRRQNVTMATITFQNYFRMYDKLGGMTGTAKTEEEEFLRIYNLEVVMIPTNRDMVRQDAADLIFKNEAGKFRAVTDEIAKMREIGRPVLVGTTSVDTSERLSQQLTVRGIPHQVLNAKQHEREASVVEDAGQPAAVTIATNMAGRGTDIKLGAGVADVGGLHIIGTERHESRRIDNQLRGRAGRQGDPGSSRFYVSLDDELMRRFGSERIVGLMERLGMEDDTPIEHRVISKSIEGAQTKVEGHNFDMRRHVVQYDDVMNKHREVIYADRKAIVSGEDMTEKFEEMLAQEIEAIIARATDAKTGAFDDDAIAAAMTALIPNASVDTDELAGLDVDELTETLTAEALKAYEEVEGRFGPDVMRKVERQVMLAVMDRLWIEHLTAMDDLREGVGLQAYGQRDPLVVYKTEGYSMYQRLLANIQHDVVHTMFRVQPAVAEQPVKTEMSKEVTTNRESEDGAPAPAKSRKVRPNDRCFCGSGKKYKFCHGAAVAKSLV